MMILTMAAKVLLLSTFIALATQATKNVFIDTDKNQILHGGGQVLTGNISRRSLTCRNNFTWPYEVASFTLNNIAEHEIFKSDKTVYINGSRALEIRTAGSLEVNTTLSVNAVAMEKTGNRTMYLGGFVLNTTKCCYVGAGPGAGMTYHGGGHGGDGGGSWKDSDRKFFYGKNYLPGKNLVGGSTGAIVYDSDPGSGGGAIRIIVTQNLIIGKNAKILANGFSIKNTTYPACSGGSSGGKILIKASKVTLKGILSADGGDSGKTSNYSGYCGDGGGGGIIDIRAVEIENASSKVSVNGGRGLDAGSDGKIKLTASFSEKRDIHINTSDCTIQNHDYHKTGSFQKRKAIISCQEYRFEICVFEFVGPVNFSNSSNVTISGKNGLEIVAQDGNITVDTKINVNGVKLDYDSDTYLGGYRVYGTKGPGKDVNSGRHGHRSSNLSYGIDPLYLIGGSVCTNNTLDSHAVGGGAISLNAINGAIILNANITANGFTNKPSRGCGASGGTVILKAKKIHYGENAYVEAKGSNGAMRGGDGGVIAGSGAHGFKADRALVDPGKHVGAWADSGHGKKGEVLDSVKEPTGMEMAACLSSTLVASSIGDPSTLYMSSETSSAQTLSAGEAQVITTLKSSIAEGRSTLANVPVHPTVTSTQAQVLTSLTSKVQALQTITNINVPVASILNSSNAQVIKEITSTISPSASSRYVQVMSSAVQRPRTDGVSAQLLPLLNATVTSESALNLSTDLKNALDSMSAMTAEDTIVSLGIMEKMAKQSIYSRRSRAEADDVTSNMLSSSNRIAKLAFSNEKINRSSAVVPTLAGILEQHGHGIGVVLKQDETFLMERATIALEITKVGSKRRTDRSFPVSQNLKFVGDDVTIPGEAFTQDNVSVVIVIMNITDIYNNSLTIDRKKIRVASNILSVSLGNQNRRSLVRPIVLRQRLTIKGFKGRELRGGFWKKNIRKDENNGWSYEGCNSVKKVNFVETKCNHMTSFAVLMTVKDIEVGESHKTVLSYITYIGCGISLFGLLLTFATFVTLDNLDPERTTIHINLVIALGISQIIYLAGIGATQNKVACTCVAVMLHYFFTAAFSWMLAEGMHLYHKVVSVFSHGSKLKFYYVVGWGLPAIIVALAAGIRSDGYGTENACWISIKGGLIWAFVAPVLIVIIINSIVLVIVVKILISSVSTVQVDIKADNKSMKQVKAGAKAMIILMPILGLSWIFGLLAVNNSTLVFQYLFCIFNSLQGLFIFLIHCIGNSEVRSAFKRLHERHALSKSIGEKSTAPKSEAKNEMDEEILVRRQQTSSSLGSNNSGDRTVTPKTLSAGQISLNSLRSLNSPHHNDGYYDDAI